MSTNEPTYITNIYSFYDTSKITLTVKRERLEFDCKRLTALVLNSRGQLILAKATCGPKDRFIKKVAHNICEGRIAWLNRNWQVSQINGAIRFTNPYMIYNWLKTEKAKNAGFEYTPDSMAMLQSLLKEAEESAKIPI